MQTLEQVQEKVRARCQKSSASPRRLEWKRISPQVLRAEDYEIHRSGQVGHFIYELHRLPFHQMLHGPCETAQEAMEAAALHQVLL
jgi:hypothetical protein